MLKKVIGQHDKDDLIGDHREGALRVNPEQAPAFRPESRRVDCFWNRGSACRGVGGRQNKALPTFVQRGILQDRCCQNRTGGTVPHAADPGFRGLRSPGNLGYVLRPLQSHSECGNRRE